MKRVLVVGVAALGVIAAGCSSSSKSGGTGGSTSPSGSSGSSAPASSSSGAATLSGSITVDAGSSLLSAFNTVKAQFEAAHPGTTITINYGASSDFATQINQGAPVDVFASASKKNMTQIGSAAVDPVDFVSNTAEIAVPPSNPAHIASVADLAKSGVKVAVCAPAVPCGVLATQVFANAKVTVHPKASLADVKTTLATVESGEVDAGIVYVTDVRAAGSKVTGIPIAADVNAKTVYPIAALKSSKNAALAAAFVAYVLSSAGKQVLTADGFSAP
ncbi:MAG: molybdate ABC transporter substrate-binding protein [Actinobacteria bacterium]|nr:molybdate ABC transporter substrate-binding protein [Actinomycetota bacterium]